MKINFTDQTYTIVPCKRRAGEPREHDWNDEMSRTSHFKVMLDRTRTRFFGNFSDRTADQKFIWHFFAEPDPESSPAGQIWQNQRFGSSLLYSYETLTS